MRRAERALWQSATTLPELGELMAAWLEGGIRSRPGYQPRCGPDEETRELIPTLAACNRAGYVTDGSQPGEQGHGYRGQWYSQRAGVSGFADNATLQRIRDAVEHTELVLIAHRTPARRRWLSRPWRGPSAGMPVTVTTDGVHTVFGARRWLDDLEGCFDEVSEEMFTALRAAWQVTLIDPEWGRNDVLWPVLHYLNYPTGSAVADEYKPPRSGSVNGKPVIEVTGIPSLRAHYQATDQQLAAAQDTLAATSRRVADTARVADQAIGQLGSDRFGPGTIAGASGVLDAVSAAAAKLAEAHAAAAAALGAIRQAQHQLEVHRALEEATASAGGEAPAHVRRTHGQD